MCCPITVHKITPLAHSVPISFLIKHMETINSSRYIRHTSCDNRKRTRLKLVVPCLSASLLCQWSFYWRARFFWSDTFWSAWSWLVWWNLPKRKAKAYARTFLLAIINDVGSKGILPPTDIHELLRCYATFAILKTFGFADFPWKSLHPHVFAGPKLKNLIVQARTAFGAFDPGIIISF